MKNLSGLMKKAQEMQERMAEMQESLAQMEVEGKSGGGMVAVVMNCKGEVKKVTIDPTLVKSDEVDILEDLITAAVNDAKVKADAKSQEEMQKITGGLQMPPGMKLPF